MTRNRLFRLGEHVVILGATGSGKTTLVRGLIKQYRKRHAELNVYILDTKQQQDFLEFEKLADTDVIQQDTTPTLLVNRGRIQIWQPILDSRKAISDWLLLIQRYEHDAIVIIDELSTVVGNLTSMPEGYPRLLKQGRGANISVVSLVQEAAYIPRQTLGQTSYVIRMFLLDRFDRMKLNKMFQLGDFDNPKSKYGFLFKKAREREPGTEYSDYRELLKG